MASDIDSGLINRQRLDSRLPCANSKPVLNLSKAVFFSFIRTWPWTAARSKNRVVASKRFLSSLTEKKEQGTSVSQGNNAQCICLLKIHLWKHFQTIFSNSSIILQV